VGSVLHACGRVGFSTPLVIRVVVAVIGVSLLAVGATAVFATENGTGSAALVSIGAVLLVAAGLWDRLESLEFAGAKLQLRIVEQLRRRADEAEARGDHTVADALRAEAQALLDEARPVAASYEQLRQSLAPGPERTAKLEQRVAQARAAARGKGHEPAEVRQLFDSGSEGNRIYALGLMLEDARLRDFAIALDVIERSRSAFEQYYGLYLAQLMLPALTNEQRRELETMLTKRPGKAAHIKPGTDRWIVAQDILSQLTSA
jgi:hypothetical protein